MKTTDFTPNTGSLLFSYDVNATNDGSSTSSGSQASGGNIIISFQSSSGQYIEAGSTVTSNTNKFGSTTTVDGHLILKVQNTSATAATEDIFITVSSGAWNGFEIISIEGVVPSSGVANIGTIAANTTRDVDILVKYTAVTPDPTATATIAVNAYETSTDYMVSDLPINVTINAKYADLTSKVDIVDVDMISRGGSKIVVSPGNTVIYLTEVTNTGDTTASNIQFSQDFSNNHLDVQSVKYSATKADLASGGGGGTDGGFVDNLVNFTLGTIAASGKMYVKVTAIVTVAVNPTA